MSMQPPPETMVYWRFKDGARDWKFGFCTYANRCGLIRMGAWNGDTTGGLVVSAYEIEWKPYN